MRGMGSKPAVGVPRDVLTSFRQTPEERARLDEARGKLSISAYMRTVVDKDLRERGQ